MSKPIVAVTGGCGFIGASLVRTLLDHGYGVKVIDNLSRGKEQYLDGLDVELSVADIRDYDALSRSIAGADQLIHLAAFGSVVESVEDPLTNFEINAQGTLNVLRASVDNDIKKFVFASTGGALMGNAVPPVDETSIPKPISPYGASKLTGEGYCHAYSVSFDLNTVAVRFANVYGPWSRHKTGVITRYIDSVKAGDPLTVFGEGTSVRDYIYVGDLVDGIYLALTKQTTPGDVFHIASGVGTNILQLANMIQDLSDGPVCEIDHQPERIGEVERNFANNDKAREILGFNPAIDMKQGLKLTWDWFEENDKVN